MLAVVERTPSGIEKPPQIVKGDLSRLPWAWAKLCYAVPFDESSNLGLRDIANNNNLVTVASTVPIWLRDTRGNTAYRVNDYVEYTNVPPYKYPAAEITAYFRMKRFGAFPDGAYLYEMGTGTAQMWTILGDPLSAGKMFATIELSSGSVTLAETGVVPTTEYASVFFRWRSGEAPQLDVLGERGTVLTSVVHGSTATGTITHSGTSNIRFNKPGSGTVKAGDFSQIMMWSRRLSDTETNLLATDPFGWYSPRRETVGQSGTYLLAPQQVINGTATAVPAQGGD